VKILLDACVWGGVRIALAAAGHDVIWAGNWPSDPGDEEILDQATAENRVLVTLDKDFGELAVRQGRTHCGIVRLVNLASREQSVVCGQILKAHEENLSRGAIITAERGRLRVRTP
jgi:predicted nuclease of predicted toxin-antitoxin system